MDIVVDLYYIIYNTYTYNQKVYINLLILLPEALREFFTFALTLGLLGILDRFRLQKMVFRPEFILCRYGSEFIFLRVSVWLIKFLALWIL